MPSVTTDSHCFFVGKRRLWVVSGTVNLYCVPRAEWPVRLRSARQHGLNTVVLPVLWGLHERVQGKPSFEGELDVAEMVAEAGRQGLWVILRVGPVVGDGIDLGGMPSWLLGKDDASSLDAPLRSADGGLLPAFAKWVGALAQQVTPLQATKTEAVDQASAPIIAVQAEHRWHCGDTEAAESYLGAIKTYLTERGFNVPTIDTNNLYATSEGAVETWSGHEDLHATVRQLRVAKPGQPRMVGDLDALQRPAWGDAPVSADAAGLARTIASVLAGGGHFNLANFAPGAMLGSMGGRYARPGAAYAATGTNGGSVLDEAGQPTGAAVGVRRVAGFASAFERVFAGLEPSAQPATAAFTGGGGPAVLESRGNQGSIVWLIREDANGRPAKSPTAITLRSGRRVSLHSGSLGVDWILTDTHLAGSSTLDLLTLTAFSRVGRALACTGPSGARGIVSINGTEVEVEVPSGKVPSFVELEGITVAVCSEELASSTVTTAEGIYFGAAMVTGEGEAISDKGYRTVLMLGADGAQGDAVMAKKPSAARAKAGALSGWERAEDTAFIDGSHPRYARIDGPTPMEALGTPTGYGWLKVELANKSARKVTVGAFKSGDRVHLRSVGKGKAGKAIVMGVGPGAEGLTAPLSLTKGAQTLTMLVDNMGRFSEGGSMRQRKGVFGELLEVVALKVPAPKVETVSPMELLPIRSPMPGVFPGDATHPDRMSWTINHRRKTDLVLNMEHVDWTGAVFLNGEPLTVLTTGVPIREIIPNDALKAGNNTIEIALIESDGTIAEAYKRIRKEAQFYEVKGGLSEGGAWSFASFESPSDKAFESVTRASLTGAAAKKPSGVATWWRARFESPAALSDAGFVESFTAGGGLWFDATGLGKGQLFLNGRSLGRYFVSTPDGKAVGTQTRYWLPTSWLRAEGENELMVFDELGFGVGGCGLV